jgi:hypothetical protein
MERRNLLKALLASPLALLANRSEAAAGPKEHPVLGKLEKVTLLGFLEHDTIIHETMYPIDCRIELEFTSGTAVFQAFNVHLEDAVLIRDNVGRLIDVTAMTLKQTEMAISLEEPLRNEKSYAQHTKFYQIKEQFEGHCSSEFAFLPMGVLEEVVIGKARFKMSSYSYNIDV